MNLLSEKIVLPTSLGIQFLDHKSILLFQKICRNDLDKPCWEVLLSDQPPIKLPAAITAERIIQSLSNTPFFQINQSCIINLTFLCEIIYKTHQCKISAPSNSIMLTISRQQLIKLKKSFEIR